MSAHLFTTQFTEYFKPLVETYCSKKGFLSRCYYSLTMHLVTREPRWRQTMRFTLFSRLLVHPFCRPSIGVTLTFKSYELRNTFHKAIPAIDK